MRGIGCNEKTVANTVLKNLLAKSLPVPSLGRCDVPKIELHLTLRHGTSGVGLVRTVLLGKFHGCGDGTEVDCFKDVLVQLSSLRTLPRISHHAEHVGQTLDTDTDRTMSHVGVLGFLDGIVVDIDNLVQVVCNLLRDLDKLLEIVGSRLLVHEHGEIDRGKIAHGNLVGCGVLDDLSAKIRGSNGSRFC